MQQLIGDEAPERGFYLKPASAVSLEGDYP
jgi:hypothetical protein